MDEGDHTDTGTQIDIDPVGWVIYNGHEPSPFHTSFYMFIFLSGERGNFVHGGALCSE